MSIEFTNVFKIAGSAAASRLLVALAPLFTTPILLSYLGVTDYGIWMVLVSVTSMLSVSDLGIANGITNRLTLERLDDDAARRIVSNAYLALVGVASILLIAALLPQAIRITWPNLLSGPSNLEIFIAAVFIPFALNVPLGLIQRILYIDHLGVLANFISVASSVLSVVFAYGGVRFNLPPALTVFLFSLSPTIVYLFVTARFFAFHRAKWSPALQYCDRSSIREILRSGAPFLALSFLVLIAGQTDYAIVASVVSVDQVAPYSIANRVIGIANSTVTVFGTALWPIFSTAIHNNEHQKVKQTIRRLNASVGLIYGVFTVCLVWGYGPLTRLWLGVDLSVSPAVLLYLAGTSFLLAFLSPYFVVLNANHDVRPQIRAYLLLTLVSVSLKVFLGRNFGVTAIAAVGFYSWALIMVPIVVKTALKHLGTPR